jgi:hypothetical protein
VANSFYILSQFTPLCILWTEKLNSASSVLPDLPCLSFLTDKWGQYSHHPHRVDGEDYMSSPVRRANKSCQVIALVIKVLTQLHSQEVTAPRSEGQQAWAGVSPHLQPIYSGQYDDLNPGDSPPFAGTLSDSKAPYLAFKGVLWIVI